MHRGKKRVRLYFDGGKEFLVIYWNDCLIATSGYRPETNLLSNLPYDSDNGDGPVIELMTAISEFVHLILDRKFWFQIGYAEDYEIGWKFFDLLAGRYSTGMVRVGFFSSVLWNLTSNTPFL